MSLDIDGYEDTAKEAVKVFWLTRSDAAAKQAEEGKSDQGERSAVTSGKHLDGFVELFVDIVRKNGLEDAEIHLKSRPQLTLPGFFRPTKSWDMLVLYRGELIAAIEFKSQVGPSFGNNYNNRAEEVVGVAVDLGTACREGAFAEQPPPFTGWLMLVEDAEASRKAVRVNSPHFPVFPEFEKASYLDRYNILCRRMVEEKLYSAACLLASPDSAAETGEFREFSPMTGLKTFVSALAGHCASTASRLG